MTKGALGSQFHYHGMALVISSLCLVQTATFELQKLVEDIEQVPSRSTRSSLSIYSYKAMLGTLPDIGGWKYTNVILVSNLQLGNI